MSDLRLKKWLISYLFITLISSAQISFAQEKEVHIGVLALWGMQTTHKMWQATINYLNKNIPQYHFILKPLTLDQTEHAVTTDSIDFILTNPGNYIDLEARFGVSRLATLKTKLQNKSASQLSAVIFTRSDRDDIRILQDLRSKSFMAVNKSAFGGFQMAWLELKTQGINPFEDFSSLQFSGHPQDKIVYAILQGDIDAGTVRSGILEQMVADGLIDINKVKILNRKTNSHFPYLHSTPLYPEWPIAKLRNTSDELAKKVTITLLELPAESIAAKQAHSSGWTVPLDYFQVRNLFKELNLPPYNTPAPSFHEKYWKKIVLILIIIISSIFIYIKRLKVTSIIQQEKLVQTETEWSTALEFLDEPIFMVDLNDNIVRANKAFYKHINSSPEEALGKNVILFTHPEGQEKPCNVCLARKNLTDTVIILESDDPFNKAAIPLEISVKVIRNSNNQPIGILQKFRDLTEIREQQKMFRRNELLFTELLDSTPDPLIISNADGTIVLVNVQFEKHIGYSRDEIIGYKVEKLIPAELRKTHINQRTEFSAHAKYRPMNKIDNIIILHKNSSRIPVEISLNPFVVDNEKLTITTIHDISKRIEKETELKRLASFSESDPNPVIEFKKDGAITYANEAARTIFPQLYQSEYTNLLNIDDFIPEAEYEIIRDIEVNGLTFEQKIIYNPGTQLYRTYIWDITKIRSLTQKMTYQATHDSLTNLINRREFERRLERSIEKEKINHITHSLCYMDLDKFKVVNDSCGHVAGDELLKQISSIINAKVRGTDTFARLGGDEFAILFEGCPAEKAAALAEDIRLTIEEYRFHWDTKTFKVGMSIGIVAIDRQSGSAKEIQSAADTACYIAKEQGRNRIHIYKTDSKEITEHTNDTNWLNRINTALDNDDFILYFQKIASVQNKNDIHYEVLIRMKGEDGQTIPPSSFIPAAERFNIMSSVDSWVIKNTLAIMSKKKYKTINLSINLSGQSLGDIKLMDNCISQIADSNIEATRICFEITETAMIANLDSAIRSVSTLRGFGCKVALDDFGSGLSSFAYLKNLPVDYLKIDGSLIKDLDHDPINLTMVSSINHIGHSMGLKTIAEYVENDAVLNILRDMKVDYVQGYGIARPVPLDEIML